MSVINFEEPESYGYRTAAPFPHTQIEGFWNDEFLSEVADEVDDFDNWDVKKTFDGAKSRSRCFKWEKLPPRVTDLINHSSRPEFLEWLEKVTGERSLIPDPYLFGGGIQRTDTGGFLKMHSDFNWHETLCLYRRINMLVYLNRGWKDEWGGELKLALSPKAGVALNIEATVSPNFNNTLIFTTDDQSFHGVPDPIRAPDGVARNAIALYYYSPFEPAGSAAVKRTDSDYRHVSGKTITDRPGRDNRSAARKAASKLKKAILSRL